MGNEYYLQLQPIISAFPHIYQFLDDNFIKGQCKSKLKNHLLQCLINNESSQNMQEHLPYLESRLAKLASVNGYKKLNERLRGATDWDEYQEFLAQTDITLWFNHKNLLKEIEPSLPHRTGSADILLSFSQQDVYCEVASFESLLKLIESKGENEDLKIQRRLQKLRTAQPWITKQNVEEEFKTNRAVRNLLAKTKRQLPPNNPGILALETGKSMVNYSDVREIAEKLFPSRLQVMLIMLWSLERGSAIGEAPFWFINPNSQYQNIGQKLLGYLEQDNKVISED